MKYLRRGKLTHAENTSTCFPLCNSSGWVGAKISKLAWVQTAHATPPLQLPFKPSPRWLLFKKEKDTESCSNENMARTIQFFMIQESKQKKIYLSSRWGGQKRYQICLQVAFLLFSDCMCEDEMSNGLVHTDLSPTELTSLHSDVAYF